MAGTCARVVRPFFYRGVRLPAPAPAPVPGTAPPLVAVNRAMALVPVRGAGAADGSKAYSRGAAHFCVSECLSCHRENTRCDDAHHDAHRPAGQREHDGVLVLLYFR